MRQWQRPWQDTRDFLLYLMLAGGVVSFVAIVATHRQSAATYTAMAVPTFIAVWRYTRTGIDVSDVGIRVTRFFGSEVVPWGQLDRIEVSADELGRPQIVLLTASGDEVETRVYRGDYPWSRNAVILQPDEFERLVGRLSELHKQARLAPGPTT